MAGSRRLQAGLGAEPGSFYGVATPPQPRLQPFRSPGPKKGQSRRHRPVIRLDPSSLQDQRGSPQRNPPAPRQNRPEIVGAALSPCAVCAGKTWADREITRGTGSAVRSNAGPAGPHHSPPGTGRMSRRPHRWARFPMREDDPVTASAGDRPDGITGSRDGLIPGGSRLRPPRSAAPGSRWRWRRPCAASGCPARLRAESAPAG